MIWADRTKRVKEARDEAKKEIDTYRKQKDDEFKKFEAEVCHPAIFDAVLWWIAWDDFWKLLGGQTDNIYSTQAEIKRPKKTQIRTLKHRWRRSTKLARRAKIRWWQTCWRRYLMWNRMCQNMSRCHRREFDHIIYFGSFGPSWKVASQHLYWPRLACEFKIE